MSEKMELAESMPRVLELAGIIHDAADGGSREEYCSWTMANRAAEAIHARLATVKNKTTSSPAQEPVTTEPIVVWLRGVDPGTDNECWVISNRVDQNSIPFVPLGTIPAPPQPGRDEIARIIEARVLGGAAWEEPQASCYRAADAILALAGEPK